MGQGLRLCSSSVTPWEQVYGAIEPGEYRIGKSVLDHRAPGDNDKYMIYACFFYAGGPE